MYHIHMKHLIPGKNREIKKLNLNPSFQLGPFIVFVNRIFKKGNFMITYLVYID